MDRKTEQELIQDLKIEEGFRSKPYRDTTNNWTICYGHNLGGRLLTKEEHKLLFGTDYAYPLSIGDMVNILRVKPVPEPAALTLLKNDIEIARKDAIIVFGAKWYQFPRDIKVAVLDMLFNLGFKKYLKFKWHIKALNEGNYEKAAEEVVKSLAYMQAPHRYKKIHDRILNAEPDPSPSVEVCHEGEFAEDAHYWSNE